MAKCVHCGGKALWDSQFGFYECLDCGKSFLDRKTHADRIRAMSDEELADKLHGLEFDAYTHSSTIHSAAWWLDWLKSPAEVEE